MELQDYIHLVRKRWRVIVATTLAALLAALALTLLTPKVYQSTAQLFVSTSSVTSAADLAAGNTFTQNQVKTYADIVTTPAVLDPAIQQLGLQTDAPTLAKSVNASVPIDTVLINIAAQSEDSAMAPRIADAVASQTAKTVPDLETVSSRRGSPVKVSVVMQAGPPEQVAPRPLRNLALSLILGLLIGFGLALLRDRVDTTVKSERDVKDVTDATVIGGIPFDTSASATPLIIQADPHSLRAEAFRVVRTNLQFVDVSGHPRVFAISSSLPGEGKTTTAANLALTMAAQGSSVCVIEGDLRRAKLSEYMGMESGVGLTSVLIGEAQLADVLQPLADTTTTLLAAGPVPPNPSELLGSPAMQTLLAELRSMFDYVIIDTPPLLPVTDAAVVSKLVDGMVLTVGAGIVRREHLTRSLEILDTVEARLLGILVNRVPTTGHDAYTYGYGYAYYGHERDEVASSGRPWWQRRPRVPARLRESLSRSRSPRHAVTAKRADSANHPVVAGAAQADPDPSQDQTVRL